MVKKPPAAQKKAKPPEGPGILHYFDSKRPLPDKPSQECQVPEALQDELYHHAVAENDPLEANIPVGPSRPAPVHRQLARLQESEPLMPLSQDEHVVVWNNGPPLVEHHEARAGASSPPASHRPGYGTNASKQRFLERQAAPARLPTEIESEAYLEGILEGIGRSNPTVGGSGSGPQARSPQEGQGLRTPAAARLHSIIKIPHSKVQKSTPSSVTFGKLPPTTHVSNKGALTTGRREKGKKRTRMLLEMLNTLDNTLSADADAGVGAQIDACNQGAASPAHLPLKRPRLGDGPCSRQTAAPELVEPGAPPAAESAEWQSSIALEEGIKAQLGKLLVGYVRGDPASDTVQERRDPCAIGATDRNECAMADAAQPEPTKHLHFSSATDAGGGIVMTPARPPRVLDSARGQNSRVVHVPPRSPYDAGAPPAQSISQQDLAKSVSQTDTTSAQRASASGARRSAVALWGDEDSDDDFEALDDIEAAVFANKVQANNGEVTMAQGGEGVVAPELQRYAGDRAAVHFRVEAVWPDCIGPSGQPETQLQLRNPYSKLEVIVHLRAPWNDQEYEIGDPVNIVVEKFDQFEGRFHCALALGAPGFIVHFPDVLLGGTRIASSGECTRRGYMAERMSSDGTNAACTKGNMYHALFQAALTTGVRRADGLRAMAKEIAYSRPADLLDSNMTEEEMQAWLVESIPSMISWLNRYVRATPSQSAEVSAGPVPSKDPTGAPVVRLTAVSEVVDIEEYIAAPKFGLKGLVDASVKLTLTDPTGSVIGGNHHPHPQVVMAPLELKSGKPRDSDAAQVLLYLLQMEERYGRPLQWGLLVHKGKSAPQLIAREENNLACLMATRNRLAAALARSQPPPLTQMKHNCNWCFERTACTLTHAASGGNAASFVGDLPAGPAQSRLTAAYETEAGHISATDAAFLTKWDHLLELESAASQKNRPEIWALTGAERQALGRCLADLVATKEVECEAGGWLYTFRKPDGSDIACGFPPGEMLMLSVDGRHAGIGRGHLFSAAPAEVVVHLDRRIRPGVLFPHGTAHTTTGSEPIHSNAGVKVSDPSVRWRLDKEEVGTTSARMRGFLFQMFIGGCDSDGHRDHQSLQAARMRSLIVDLAPPEAPPAQLDAATAAAIAAQITSFGLNAEQAEAVRRAVTSQDYTLVLGMPGAGKTTAVVAMIRALAACGKRVLLTSYTNSAVDNVLLKLADCGDDVSFVRVGREDRVHPGLLPWLPGGSRHKATTAGALAHLGDSVSVVGVSALGCSDPLVRRQPFDVCIVDEAGQITLPATLGPLLRSRAFVLVGDHHQLPPLVTSKAAAEGGLDQPLFAHLAAAHPDAVVSLPVQYRMSSDIQVLPNVLTYGGQLRCGSEAVAAARLELNHAALAEAPAWIQATLSPDRRVVFLDTSGLSSGREHVVGESVSNPGEACVASTLLKYAASAGISQGSLAAISPYNRQVVVLGRALRASGLTGVESLTIDRAQGRDKECVVVSLVRSNEDGSAGKLLADARRVNVALTRAKAKLVLVGDCRTLRTLPLFEKLIRECEQRGWVLPLPAAAMEALEIKDLVPQ